MSLLLQMTFDADQQVASAARKSLLEATTHMLWAGFIEPVRKALEGNVPEDLKPRIRAVVRESYARLSLQKTASQSENQNPETKTTLEDWLKSLESGALHAQLVENVAGEPWSHHFDDEEWKERVRDLAERLYADPVSFTKELDWLSSSDAKAAAEMGHFFGRQDARNLKYLKQIFDAALNQQSEAFARGYVYGITERPRPDLDYLNLEIDRVQQANPRLAFYIMLPAGDSVRSFDRAQAMVGSRKIAPMLFSNLQLWVGNRKTTPTEAGQAVRLLLPIAQSGGREATDVALNFVAYQINRVSPEEKAGLLGQIFGENFEDLWTLLDLFVANPSREGFWFAAVLTVATEIDPVRGCNIASRMIVGESFALKNEGEKLLVELVQAYPHQVMDAIGRRITDDATKNQFYIRKFAFLSTIPFEIVKSWLDRMGVEGARAIARHLPPPFLDSKVQPQVPPLTNFVLTHFEGDQRTFSEFVAGVHSLQVYWGSYSEARQREALQAKAFLTHRTRRIREWAILEVRRAEEDARIHGIREDESGLT